ncbi:DUF6542 domain-containing protein [Mycolicibacter icosiumassiliensis]|uniref:DUF6542 domain-containing protein n=1 Tax=Mycolicibacter icosiumassiliensis TaxID=1792835 RepID=UPI001F1646B8|nr:DUF6542 domain-containing protein [Mycolicibacter icosiumassiliensis]
MAVAREKSAVAADHRSILPSIAGLPWWSAVAVAVVASAIGVAFDAGSGDKELTIVFSALYAMGCIAAVLMVQQSAVFTTVVQPPLILFIGVPSAYWLLRGGGFPGLKAIVINCGYPLIERFPLMLFTAAAVLLIGMLRWYLGMLDGTAKRDTRDAEDDGTPKRTTLSDRIGAMLTSALNRNPAHAIEQSASREQRPGRRPRRATAESRRAARAASGSRSRTGSAQRRGGGDARPPRHMTSANPAGVRRPTGLTSPGDARARPRTRRAQVTRSPGPPGIRIRAATAPPTRPNRCLGAGRLRRAPRAAATEPALGTPFPRCATAGQAPTRPTRNPAPAPVNRTTKPTPGSSTSS